MIDEISLVCFLFTWIVVSLPRRLVWLVSSPPFSGNSIGLSRLTCTRGFLLHGFSCRCGSL